MRVSEIRVNRIRVNQGLGVILFDRNFTRNYFFTVSNQREET